MQLQFNQVSKTYNKQQALNQVSLDVKSSECFGLIGANGAGKTTLIKSLLDFVHIDDGTIHIANQPHRSKHARLPIVFLPERFTPPYFLKGAAFLRYVCDLHDRTYSAEHVTELCKKLDLDVSALDKTVKQLSKGMAQKLGLISCFLVNKPIIILDEPMSGLDPKARILLKRLILENKAAGKSLFFSSHMLADVDELCDRIGIIHQGTLRFIGTPTECKTQFGEDQLEQAYLKCISADG